MMRITADGLQRGLETQGIKFSRFSLTQIGEFSEADADWNYKDIPHLNEVHKLVEGVPAVVGDDLVSNYFLQKIGPLRLPLTVMNYSSSKNSQVYYTSALFFVLIIETVWSACDSSQTKVETTYRVGSQRSFKFLHPMIHLLLKRNYKVLMREDIPMRLQRGKLRSRGLCFRGDEVGYSFLGTLKIHQDNVIVGRDTEDPSDVSIRDDDLPTWPSLLSLGTDDHRGVMVSKLNEKVVAFPRICPHEGAPLDSTTATGDLTTRIRCPWHGREITGTEIPPGESRQIMSCVVHRDSTFQDPHNGK
jgi:Rieske [2Fe-2S] domain